MTFTSDKNVDNLFSFSVDGSSGIPTGSDPESRVGDQHIGSQLIRVNSEFHVLGEPEFCRVRS